MKIARASILSFKDFILKMLFTEKLEINGIQLAGIPSALLYLSTNWWMAHIAVAVIVLS